MKISTNSNIKFLKTIVKISLFLIISVTGFTQQTFKIIGRVINEDGNTTIGNAIALNPVDSSFVTGTSFFEEEFRLENIILKNVLLKLSSLQFEDKYIVVTFNGGTTANLGDIFIQKGGIDLDEIVVKSKRPTYIQKPDGTIEIYIENTTLSASNSVTEILSKSPDVLVDGNGGISVFGKGIAVIYINGRRIQNSQLTSISPSNIKKIEIIRNPSAKYDAEGGAVINITTITTAHEGYQVKLLQNISHSDFGGDVSYTNINLNYKNGKVTTQGNYSIQLGQTREKLFTTRDRLPIDGFLNTDVTTLWEYDFDLYTHYGIGMLYDVNDKSYFSIDYSGFIEGIGGKTNSTNIIEDEFSISNYESVVDVDEKDTNNSISVNYGYQLDTLGSSLFIGSQYAKFDIQADNNITENSQEDFTNSTRYLQNLLNLNIDIYSAQADLAKVFNNKYSIDFGAKYSYIENDFEFDFLTSSNKIDFTIDNEISNEFHYNESIAALYIDYKQQINETLNFNIGGRVENTRYNLSLSQSNEDISDNYYSLFPSASISKQLPSGQRISLIYSSRISRPPYQRLNPVLIYQDRYTSSQGNPTLQSQIKHSFKLNTKVKSFNIKLGYNYGINPFGRSAIRGTTDRSYILKSINYDKSHEFYTSASRTFTYYKWTSINTLNLRIYNVIDDKHQFERVEPTPNIYMYTNNIFDITNTFNIELLAWYRGHNNDGLHSRNSGYLVTVTLEKSFLDKQLKLRLIANDIFWGYFASGDYNVGQTQVYYNRKWSTNYYKLSVSYNFGRLKKNGYKNKSTGGSELRRAG